MKYLLSKQRSASAKRLSGLVCASLALLMSACSDSGTTTTLDAQPALEFELPDSIQDASFIQKDDRKFLNVFPDVTLSNGVAVSVVQRSAQSWSGTVNLKTDAVYKVTVTWREPFNGQNLALTSRTFDLSVGKDGSLGQSAETPYIESDDDTNTFDFDNDGQTNFDERRVGSDPLTADAGDLETDDPVAVDAAPIADVVTFAPLEPGNEEPAIETDGGTLVQVETPTATGVPVAIPVTADVIVPRISQSDAPAIDGSGVTLGADNQFTGEWAPAVQSDIGGTVLGIDNLMIDINAEATGATPFRRWAAMHDGSYLYLVVIVDDNGARHRDSGTNLNDDDSLELFLDADNRKSSFYDNNDFHRIFPLREAGDRASKRGLSSGDVAGPNSSTRELRVDFSTGPGIGPDGLRRRNYEQDVYELRIALDSAGISSDAPFGFELQVNDDDDGVERDSKWGWKHPGRVDVDVDNTVNNPSFMGTLMLE